MMSLMSLKRRLDSVPLLRAPVLAAWRLMKLPSQYAAGRALARRIQELDAGGGPRIWYFGRPTHPNLGDQAQCVLLEDWLATAFSGYEIVEITTWAFFRNPELILRALKDKVGGSDLFVMQSGYTMNDGNPDEIAHQLIPAAFPHHLVVFMPQTILYREQRNLQKARKALSGKDNVLLLCRDAISFGTATTMFPGTDCLLYPDIVTRLIGGKNYENPRSGVLFCLRDDSEKLISDVELERCMREVAEMSEVKRTDTSVSRFAVDWMNTASVARYLNEVFEEYSRYRVIVTDRYHGTIFSLIAGTPVVVLKTTDHKVTTGADWFTDSVGGAVLKAESVELVPGLVRRILDDGAEHRFEPVFERSYYEVLKQRIDDKLERMRH